LPKKKGRNSFAADLGEMYKKINGEDASFNISTKDFAIDDETLIENAYENLNSQHNH
jgi:hypothetical protein